MRKFNPLQPEKLKMKCIAIAALLLATSLAGNALTLGKASGSVIVGQPLALMLSVQSNADELASQACFEAEVFYGDLRQNPSRVSVTEPTPTIEHPGRQLRITSSTPINEPVVTLWVSAGCKQQIRRRFVFFSDVESEVDTIGTSAPIRAPKTSDAVLASAPSKVNVVANELLVQPEALRSRPKLQVETRVPAKQVRKVRKDEPVDPDLGVALGKRVDALAEWQELNLSPDAVMKRSAQLRLLEGELLALREAANKNQTAIDEMSGRIGVTQASQPEIHFLVFAVLGALLALVMGLIFFRFQSVSTGRVPWWGGRSGEHLAIAPETTNATPDAPLQSYFSAEQADYSNGHEAVSMQSKLPDITALASPDVDIDLDFGDLPDTVGSETYLETQAPGDFLSLRHGPQKAAVVRDTDSQFTLNLREMMDVRQQAEFFMTLGQHDEAVATLVTALEGDGNANPLVYLDLLKVFHALSKKVDFDQYKDEFNRLFSGKVPEYALFNQPGHSLEFHKEVCDELVRTWPSQTAIDYIESQLIRPTSGDDVQEFDLEAYQDLLLLHGVLKRIGGEVESDFISFSAPKNSVYAALDQREAKESLTPAETQNLQFDTALTSPIELDFDLSLQETKPSSLQVTESKSDNLIDFDLSDFPSVPVTLPKA
jgi:hypothetical protein